LAASISGKEEGFPGMYIGLLEWQWHDRVGSTLIKLGKLSSSKKNDKLTF
jgi:hypothetical protein